MKCAEVIEWMHRYLDHDLSREEITEMFRHIDHCLPCAEIFDRLTMLSRELEQLPDVKPPFSLVDSILPKLDELDRGIVSLEQGESEDNVIVPFTRPNTQGKRKMGSSMARRTGIGAVAAAIILGVAIFNMPEQIPGAQVEDMMKSSSNNTAAGGDAAAMMNSDAGNSADTANTGPAQNNPVEDSMIMEARIAESGDPATNAPETFIAGTEAGEPSTDSMAGADSSPEDVLPHITNNKTPKQQATSTPPNKKTGSTNQSESSGQPSTGDSNAKRDPEVKASMQPDINQEQGIMSLVPESSVLSEKSWTSPNGSYTAALEDQKLIIYSVTASDKGEEKTAVDSVPLQGKWVSGEWTPDSLHFIYVTHTNGADVQKVYAVSEAGTSSVRPSPPGESSTK